MAMNDQDEIIFHAGGSADGHPLYPGFKPEVKILPAGSIHKEGALALPCDIFWQRDVAVSLRDGVVIYVDIYRPAHAHYLMPAIISAGPFGKNGGVNRAMFDAMPWRSGVPQCTVSSLEKFEGLDPAYWCLHGYALVHPDVRGSWRSGGETRINSVLDGRDGYDLVEWLALQEWCNGRVSFAGNSWLSQTQWFVGAERPPHLACLAPWEGWCDLYNDSAMRGGVPSGDFQQFLLDVCCPGLGKVEDVVAMTQKHPCWDQYWEDRKANCHKIDVPLYVVASWTNALHTRGTFKGYLESSSTRKWLRVHNSHEWPDLYYPQNTEDLRKFFDFYMKDVKNDWEYTPAVRLCILNPGHADVVNRPEQEFPLQRQILKKLFLDCKQGSLQLDLPFNNQTQIDFDGATGLVEFSFVFEEQTELTGFFSLKVWAEAVDMDDIDLFAKFSKLSGQDELLETVCIDVGYLQDDPGREYERLRGMHLAGDKAVDVFFAEGSTGRLRASHRELDEKKSTQDQPVYTHQREQKLRPGEIVPMIIEMWPCGMQWEAGEKLKLAVAGYNPRPEQVASFEPKSCNRGRVVLHAGGQYDSFLLVPFIPKAV